MANRETQQKIIHKADSNSGGSGLVLVLSKTNRKRASDDTASLWNELGRVSVRLNYSVGRPN